MPDTSLQEKTMSQSTPGPWRVERVRPTERESIAAQPFTIRAPLGVVPHGLMGDCEGDIVAVVEQNPSDPLPGMAEANARLIAAAPDLLRVAQAASHALRSYEFGNASIELAKAVADAIGLVLAKAEGRPGEGYTCAQHRGEEGGR